MSISPNGIEVEENGYPDDRAAKKAEEIAREIFHISYIEIGGPGKDIVAAELRKAYTEIERLQTMLGQSQSDLMGCRDGALMRDLRAEIGRLRAELAKVKP